MHLWNGQNVVWKVKHDQKGGREGSEYGKPQTLSIANFLVYSWQGVVVLVSSYENFQW